METTTKPKPFVFVLMPFDKEFTDIYQLGIKTAANDAGGYCERVDEQIFEERILDRIYNQIDKADVVVADLTGKNPNVFYETGYAHALGKRVILLTQKVDDIPFDLRHHFHIVYDGSIMTLKNELTKRLKWYIENPAKKNSPSVTQLEYYIDNQKIENNGNVYLKKWFTSGGFLDDELNLNIDIYNGSSTLFSENYKLGIVIGSNITVGSTQFNKIPYMGAEDMHQFITAKTLAHIFPGDWLQYGVKLFSQFTVNNNSIPITLRTFTELGYYEMNFTLRKFESSD